MARLLVKNWKEFQHYKDRNPTWIKLHKSLLDDYVFHRLPLASRALAPMLWLLSSESADGSIDYDIEMIAFRLRSSKADVIAGLNPLIDKGFIHEERDSSDALAESYHKAIPEERREETYKSNTDTEKSRATRIPPDFHVTQAHELFAAEHNYPHPSTEIHKFIDHFKSKPGKDGTSLDWNARFRVWLSKAQQYSGVSNGQDRPINRGRARFEAQRMELEKAEAMDQGGTLGLSGYDERDDPGRSPKQIRGHVAGDPPAASSSGLSQVGNAVEILSKARRIT